MNPFADVREFMRVSGQHPSPELSSLYLTLVREEFEELMFAWNLSAEEDDIRKAEIADACTDICVVAIGLMEALGIDASRCWAEVHKSNMAKFVHTCEDCEGRGFIQMDDDETVCPTCRGSGKVVVVRRREDGKVVKPIGWEPPDLLSVVRSGNESNHAE